MESRFPGEKSSIKSICNYLSHLKLEGAVSENSFENTELKDSDFTMNISDIDISSFASEDSLNEGNLNDVHTPIVHGATKRMKFSEAAVKLIPKELKESSLESPSFADSELCIQVNHHCTCLGYLLAPSIEFSRVPTDCSMEKNLFLEGILPLIRPSFVQVSCGFDHSVALTDDGKVMTWGNGDSGCLGQGSTTSSDSPLLVRALLHKKITSVEAGAFHNAAVSSDGGLYTWGRGDVHQLGIPFRHLLKDDKGHISLVPNKISSLGSVVGAACGEAHTLVLDSKGKVFAFGWAEDGQLGLPSNQLFENKMTKKIATISALQGEMIVKVAAGALFSTCLSASGQVFAWGNGEMGQLGRGKHVLFEDFPKPVECQGKVVSLVCGEASVLCMTDEGTLYAWGLGVAGVLDQAFEQGAELSCFVPQPLVELKNTVEC